MAVYESALTWNNRLTRYAAGMDKLAVWSLKATLGRFAGGRHRMTLQERAHSYKKILPAIQKYFYVGKHNDTWFERAFIGGRSS